MNPPKRRAWLAYSGWAIYPTSRFSLHKYVDKGRDERSTVTPGQIFPVHSPKLLNRVFMEEDQIDVEGHAEGPEAINTKKPVAWSESQCLSRLKQPTSGLRSLVIGRVRMMDLVLVHPPISKPLR